MSSLTRTPARLSALAGAALLIVGVLIAISAVGRAKDNAPVATSTPIPRVAVDGLPERNGVLGRSTAKYTLTEYADLQCPICRRYTTDTLPAVVTQLVRTGRLKLALQPLSFLGPDSVRAAQVAMAAKQQGHLWPFLDRLFLRQGAENSGWVTDDLLRTTLTEAKVDPARAFTASTTASAQQGLTDADTSARQYGIDSTPSFTITGPDGKTTRFDADALDPKAFVAALKEVTR